MSKKSYDESEINTQLAQIGISQGDVLLVHTAFSKVKPVNGGPRGLIDILIDYLGEHGTLVMPTMSYKDEQVFDPLTTPCKDEMGILADTFWRLPDVRRSDNHGAFAAYGQYADQITASHPIDVPHGLNSPVGRVYELDGKVLLLGVDHTSNTTIHLAESLAGARYRCQAGVTILKDGQPEWFKYEEINHCCQKFGLMDEWLDARSLQLRGQIGHAGARLIRSKNIVDIAVEHLKQEETIFLHEIGVDEECDEARQSLLKLG